MEDKNKKDIHFSEAGALKDDKNRQEQLKEAKNIAMGGVGIGLMSGLIHVIYKDEPQSSDPVVNDTGAGAGLIIAATLTAYGAAKYIKHTKKPEALKKALAFGMKNAKNMHTFAKRKLVPFAQKSLETISRTTGKASDKLKEVQNKLNEQHQEKQEQKQKQKKKFPKKPQGIINKWFDKVLHGGGSR